MTAQPGSNAQIFTVESQANSVGMTNESMDAIGSGTPVLLWQISDAAKNVFDPEYTFTVEVSTDGGASWSTASPSNYDLRYLVGVVEFQSDPFGGSTSGNLVRIADGHYLPKHAILEGYSSGYEQTRTQEEIPQFQDDGQRRLQLLLDITVEFEMYETRGLSFDSGSGGSGPSLKEILAGENLSTQSSVDPLRIYSFEPTNAESRLYRAWMLPESISVDAEAGSAQSQSVNWNSTEQSAAMSSQVAKPADSLYY